MIDNTFSLQKQHNSIAKKFTNNGWIDIYQSGTVDGVDTGIYCSIVKPEYLKTYLRDNDWGIQWGSEGRPSVTTYFRDQKEITEYKQFGDDGLEPFIYVKFFSHADERYVDISEEFVNYFKLYEKGVTKQQRSYYFIDDSGDAEEVIHIEPNKVKMKLRFLNEYLSIRQVHLSLCFYFMVVTDIETAGDAFTPKDEDFITEFANYNHLIRVVPGLSDGNLQSWLLGKTILKYDPSKSSKFWFDLHDEEHENFIIGFNDDGTELLARCDSEQHKFFTSVFFRKEVLDKYYGNPSKYKVDGFGIHSKFISLKMDNNNDNYVVVFLNDLRMLPPKEQLHWKHHNIPPGNGMGISGSYYDTMIMGNWARDSDSVDVRFKSLYKRFNIAWFKKFGWYFYKLPAGTDIANFEALHVPSENNIRSFCEQMLILVKMTIDSLNEEMLVKDLPKVENERGISKFERFLNNKNINIPDLFNFLRSLYDLRSGMLAHRFSDSNKKVKQAVEFFGLTDDRYREVAFDIFVKSLYTLNTLTGLYLSDEPLIELEN